jgi:uncharacterized membrane protein
MTQRRGWDLVECVAAALALIAALVWFGSSLVGSFRPDTLARPYWSGGPRTDTAGVVALVVLVVSVAVSETLRLWRRRSQSPGTRVQRLPLSSAALVATGVAAAGLVGGIALAVYLSVNAVTHPATLGLQATHFATWPTESTLRVLALAAAGSSSGWLRFVTIRWPGAWIGS